ncbi:homocysteine S-methyltransferase family protein [Anaerosporobacter faecicola]|uniref:homocysteine S-methyltransferase family protein n=1 Tax=Anaerosporobacter faecicola TaxID=2718714 RepID=UPI00143C4983|nr:homocysteine S-methyltransferase family protein [Anaerosporobacter faecicola]
MNQEEFLSLCRSKIVLLDGATGSNLQKAGMPTGVCPEDWILKNPEALVGLQKEYVLAGTDILYSPTFTANRIKLEEYGLEENLVQMNTALVALSKQAIKQAKQENPSLQEKSVYVAGDLTMTGQQLYPIGTLLFEELVDVYKEQIRCLVKAGVDLIVVETMMSLQECRAALLAAKETCDLPVMVTMTFNEDGHTMYGTDARTAVTVLQNLGAAAIGVNCSTGPDQMRDVVMTMRNYTSVPIIAKPNAGLPVLVEGETVFNLGAEEFGLQVAGLVKDGAMIVGGCCGTTPDHIRELALQVEEITPDLTWNPKVRALSTERKTVEIDLDGKFLIVGERINPTGKKKLQEELRAGKLDLVTEMAQEQEENGASILDVNMGMNGIDEKERMIEVVYELSQVSSLPLCIDSSHVSVIEAALRIYPGRALINSISLEKEKFEKLIPLAKKYGAMFILLPLSDKGLPKDIEEKKSIIHTITDAAYAQGLTKEDIIVDGLVNTIGANKRAAIETLETIRYCKKELQLATIVGLSNISFGLPERQFVNSTFLALAIHEGLTMAIANPSQDLLVNTAFATDLLCNKEEADLRYITRVTSRPMTITSTAQAGANKVGGSQTAQTDQTKDQIANGSTSSVSSPMMNSVSSGLINGTDTNTGNKDKQADAPTSIIYTDVIKGNRKGIIDHVKEMVTQGEKPASIVDQMLIPAINEVGRLFDKQIYFLPQLIGSAETMKMAIDYLEPLLQSEKSSQKLGTIVIATVQGDIHDIGKNLVALMLKNYGFEVIDLGKDVPCEKIIETAKEKDADIIALSALMTTTMLEMKKVVQANKKAGLRAKVIIGGAVITQSYADEIHADGYSTDAQDAVRVVKRLLAIS